MSGTDGSPSIDSPLLSPHRIVGIYLVFGVAWVFASNYVIWTFALEADLHRQADLLKGLVFVASSTVLLSVLARYTKREYAAVLEELRSGVLELSILHRLFRHNLRNVATVIAGRVAVAGEDASSEHLEIIDEKADDLERLATRAGQLRDVAEEVPHRVTRDVAEVVRSVAAEYRDAYPEASIDVDAPETLEGGVPPRLESAVGELVENAITHNDGPTVVAIEAESTHDGLAVRVADDGDGIPELERRTLERDVEDRLDHSRGLGLWLVRLIVDNGDGRVAISESDLGGSCVEFVFPNATD